jgi:hypothetical protein
MDQDRERRLKELEKAGAIEGAQLAQGELARLTQEQKNNLQQERLVLSQQAQERAIISQAAEMGVQNAADSMQQQGQVQTPPAMNTQTQQILSKYGINPNQKVAPKSTTTVRNTTKQGSTVIENITNTTTTNHNVVKIIQPNIPVSQPHIAMRQGAISNAKFKSWLQKANAQQEELANSQMNDYNRRERSLLRSTNRMMKKLQDLSKTIGRGLDPENMTNSVSGSLKTLMFLFIGSMIPIVWKPLMEKIETFEANFRSFFGMELPGNLKTKAGTVQGWKRALGLEGEDINKKGIPGAIGGLISDAFQRLFDRLELEKNDRIKAISRLEGDKPDSITDMEGWVKYLGKLAAAAVGGSEAQATYDEGGRVEEEKRVELENSKLEINGREVSMLGEFDSRGNLKSEDSAMKLAQLAINETDKDTIDISKIQASLEKLRDFSKSQGKLIPLAPEFISKIENLVSKEELAKLLEKYSANGGYRENQTDYVFKYANSDYDPSDHYSISDKVDKYGSYAGKLGTTAGTIGGGIAGAVGTAGVGTGAGAVIGGSLGYMAGRTLGSLIGLGHGVVDMVDAYLDKPGAQMSLVPLSSISEKEKRQMNFHKNYTKAVVSEVSPEFMNELFGIASKNASKNAFRTENFEAIRTKFANKGKKITVDAQYEDAAHNAKMLKLRKTDLKKQEEENTQLGRFENNVKTFIRDKGLENFNIFSSREPEKAEIGDVPADKNTAAKKIIEYLKDKLNITKEQAAGIAGNLFVESKFSPTILGDKGEALGLAQWRDSRRKALVKEYNTEQPSFDQQLDFLVKELNSTEKTALNALKKQTTVKDSTLVFAKLFERPATGSDGYPLHFDRRWGYAEKFYKLPTEEKAEESIPSPIRPADTISATDFTPTFKSPENFTSTIASNMTTSTKDSEEAATPSQLVVATKGLAEAAGISAQLDSIPRQQNIVNNITQPAPKQQAETGWKSQT